MICSFYGSLINGVRKLVERVMVVTARDFNGHVRMQKALKTSAEIVLTELGIKMGKILWSLLQL